VIGKEEKINEYFDSSKDRSESEYAFILSENSRSNPIQKGWGSSLA
jgi:hypothetical protein